MYSMSFKINIFFGLPDPLFYKYLYSILNWHTAFLVNKNVSSLNYQFCEGIRKHIRFIDTDHIDPFVLAQ